MTCLKLPAAHTKLDRTLTMYCLLLRGQFTGAHVENHSRAQRHAHSCVLLAEGAACRVMLAVNMRGICDVTLCRPAMVNF